jgi:DNA repair exonuclease SbcCD ATPase subunit
MGQFTYLDDVDYKKLNSQERKVYIQNLEKELVTLQQRKADAIANNERYQQEIQELKNRLAELDSEYNTLYNSILERLNVSGGDIESARRKIEEFRRRIDNWNALSDSELWKNAKAINQTIVE